MEANDMRAKLAVLRQRVQLQRQAEDTVVAAVDAVSQGKSLSQAETAALRVAIATPPPLALEPELREAMRAFAEAQEAEPFDDEMAALFGQANRVSRFCKASGIVLADAIAAHEALRYVNLTAQQRFVTIWLDLSGETKSFRHRASIERYVQAMRAAISRLRRQIRSSGSRRLLRDFGITLHEVEQIEYCPGLYRVVLDSRADKEKDRIALFFCPAALDALTLETEESRLAPSPLEQRISLAMRGVKP